VCAAPAQRKGWLRTRATMHPPPLPRRPRFSSTCVPACAGLQCLRGDCAERAIARNERLREASDCAKRAIARNERLPETSDAPPPPPCRERGVVRVSGRPRRNLGRSPTHLPSRLPPSPPLPLCSPPHFPSLPLAPTPPHILLTELTPLPPTLVFSLPTSLPPPPRLPFSLFFSVSVSPASSTAHERCLGVSPHVPP
jgi:hypothetical protein